MLESSLWNFRELVTLVWYLVRNGIYCVSWRVNVSINVCVRARVCVCSPQEHLTHVDVRLEMMKHQVRESNQSIKTLQEDMRREVCNP